MSGDSAPRVVISIELRGDDARVILGRLPELLPKELRAAVPVRVMTRVA